MTIKKKTFLFLLGLSTVVALESKSMHLVDAAAAQTGEGNLRGATS